ncbi:hypothetical protein ADU90_00225 [Clostridium botulinum]|uniref:NEAT domain-containing protein n=1 Tax=Clostridium botulinum TaxID=1491 RepID=UPI0006A4B164|nr:NEAT domain-containing protein [Clostridium botulinum]KOC53091.1 hypothetical protein ADU89_09430 [Clostridium botulinum]KOC58519.1 hypothetical protein ADU90_00225 [Clostridium botulinum]
MSIYKKINKGLGVATTAVILAGGVPQVAHAMNNDIPRVEAKKICKNIEQSIKNGTYKSNVQIQSSTSVVEGGVREKSYKNEEKDGLYEISIRTLKEKEDSNSMAGAYIEKVNYEVKDGKKYLICSLDSIDWMENIIVAVDGKDTKITPTDVVAKQSDDGKGKKKGKIKFKIGNLDSKIIMKMNVQPMGNARVTFRVILQKDSANLVKEYNVQASQKQNSSQSGDTTGLEAKPQSSKTEKSLNAPPKHSKVSLGTFWEDYEKYRVEFPSKYKTNEMDQYKSNITEITVNGTIYEKALSVEKNNKYYFGLMGLDLSSNGFNQKENILVIKATGYEDMVIKVNGKDQAEKEKEVSSSTAPQNTVYEVLPSETQVEPVDNKESISKEVTNKFIKRISIGKINSDYNKFRIEFSNALELDYGENLKEVLVNGNKYEVSNNLDVREDNKYYFGLMGFDLSINGFDKEENVITIKSNKYTNFNIVVKKDATVVKSNEEKQNISDNQADHMIGNSDKKTMSVMKTEYTRDYGADNAYKYQIMFNTNLGNEELYRQQLKEIIVNGISYKKAFSVENDNTFYFSRMALDLNTRAFNKDENELILKADGFEDLRLKIRKDGSLIKENQTDALIDPSFNLTNIKPVVNTDTASVASEKIRISESTKLEDGLYTIGFKAYRVDRPSQTSMLGGFFDDNVKVEVKEGKIYTTWLNLLKAHMLYDFRIENDGKYPESIPTNYGEADNYGKYEMQTFKIPMDNFITPHTGGVTVSAMGGQKNYVGHIEKYTKVTLKFDTEIRKGWEGFKYEKEKEKEKSELQNKIFEALGGEGLDFNHDGKIDSEDLNRAQGELVLSSKELSDISWIKYLGGDVTGLYINGNNIKDLPEGVFDRLVNLERLDLSGNRLSSLPTGIFDKLTKLKYLYLSGNQLKSINKDAFNKLTKLEELALDRNHIFNIPQGVFNNLTKLKLIGISENRLNNLPRDIFINNTELTSVNFSNNNIKEMPTSIKNANNLQEIIAHNNNIEILPKELKNLNNLEKLHLTNNSIKEIPVDIFKSLNKLTILEMNNNDIISVPDNIEEILPNLFKGMYSSGLQLKYNRLTKISEKLNRLYEKEKFKYVPQKNLMNLKLVNDNGTLRWDHKLSALDILCWGETPNSFFDNIDPKTLEEYSKYLNGRSTIDVLNKKGWDWTIQVEVQKKNEHGDFETIHTVTTEEEEDKVGNYSVGNIENNDDYRIVKSLYGTTMNDKSLIFKETAYIGDTLNNSLAINNTKPSPEPTPIEGNSGASSNIKPENKPQAKPEVQPKNKENQVSKTKDINVQVLKEKSHEPSMAAQYVEKTIKYTEKDGKKYFTVTLNRMDWMKNVAIEVGGNKVTAEKKENGNIGEYTFEVGSEKEEVMMRMNVVPMGNARVAFRIVNAAAAPKDTTKQDVEPEEPKDTVKPEKPDNTEKPNEKPEIPKDTEKSIIKKEKPAIYEAKVIVDVINKENEKVITNYVDVEQKINVEVKDKQAYMTIKLKGKQKDIKGIKVDGKVAKFEVVEQEVVKQNRLAALNAERAVNTDKNKESTTIRFKIPNEKVNVEIIMHDEVENKNVSFEVKLKEDTIKEIKDNSKQDVKTSNTTSSTSHSHHRRKKHNKESEDVKDNKEDKKDTKDDNTSSKDTKIKEDGNNSDKPNNDVKDHALKNDNSKDNKDTKKENKKDNNASEKQKSKNDVNVNNKNDESKKVQAEYSKQNEEQQKQNKIVSTQKAINTKISIKKNSKGNKNIEIKEKKLPQTGTPFGSGLFTTIGSAISALGVMLMRKNKKK